MLENDLKYLFNVDFQWKLKKRKIPFSGEVAILEIQYFCITV